MMNKEEGILCNRLGSQTIDILGNYICCDLCKDPIINNEYYFVSKKYLMDNKYQIYIHLDINIPEFFFSKKRGDSIILCEKCDDYLSTIFEKIK